MSVRVLADFLRYVRYAQLFRCAQLCQGCIAAILSADNTSSANAAATAASLPKRARIVRGIGRLTCACCIHWQRRASAELAAGLQLVARCNSALQRDWRGASEGHAREHGVAFLQPVVCGDALVQPDIHGFWQGRKNRPCLHACARDGLLTSSAGTESLLVLSAYDPAGICCALGGCRLQPEHCTLPQQEVMRSTMQVWTLHTVRACLFGIIAPISRGVPSCNTRSSLSCRGPHTGAWVYPTARTNEWVGSTAGADRMRTLASPMTCMAG